MAIHKGDQCFCSDVFDPALTDKTFENDACGDLGLHCAIGQSDGLLPAQCNTENSVFELKKTEKSRSDCDDYFLFDQIPDKKEKPDKSKDKSKDKRITLGDMCPYECSIPDDPKVSKCKKA